MSPEKSTIASLLGLGSIGGIWAAIHAAAPDGVSFNAGSLAITVILLVVMSAIVVGMFTLLLAEKEARIKELKQLAFGATDLGTEAVKLAQTTKPPTGGS